MTLCPIALMVGCKGCLLFSVCPLKGLIGDDKKEDVKKYDQTPTNQTPTKKIAKRTFQE